MKLTQIFKEFSQDYGEHLKSLGYKYPTHDQVGKEYINVHGDIDEASIDKPYVLVTYEPEKAEYHHKNVQDAFRTLQGMDPKPDHWQIIHSITGEVHYDAAAELKK